MTANQISLVQSVVNLLRGLAIILAALALALFAAGVFFSAGRRRHALWFVGIDTLTSRRLSRLPP
jgi:hypothetical protein